MVYCLKEKNIFQAGIEPSTLEHRVSDLSKYLLDDMRHDDKVKTSTTRICCKDKDHISQNEYIKLVIFKFVTNLFY